MKYSYRVKYVNLEESNWFGELLGWLFLPFLMQTRSGSCEWWEVQCRNHWWNPWKTCVSAGGMMINSSVSKEYAIEEMKVLKENNVGYYDFHFDYKINKFHIKEKFDTPRRKMKFIDFEAIFDEYELFFMFITFVVMFCFALWIKQYIN